MKYVYFVKCFDTTMRESNVWELEFERPIDWSSLEDELDVAFEGYLDIVVGLNGDRESIHYDYHSMFAYIEGSGEGIHNLRFTCKFTLDAVLTGNDVVLF